MKEREKVLLQMLKDKNGSTPGEITGTVPNNHSFTGGATIEKEV